LQALTDGILDAGILRVYEGRFRPEEKHEVKWLDHQTGKMGRALAALEKAPPTLGSKLNVGDITLACALGYLDFRFGNELARDVPQAREVARRIREQGSGLRRYRAALKARPKKEKAPGPKSGAFLVQDCRD